MMAKHPKHLAVLNAAAEKAEYGKPLPKGVFRGIAQQMGYGSYVAAVAEVSVSSDGLLTIHRIVGASPTRRWSSGRSPARSCSDCRRSSTVAAP
jgi:isoquinoline 1-oxidoreductase beta subunit